MNISDKAKQTLDFSKACYLQGLCTEQEYTNAIKKIIVEDTEQQMIKFLVDKGFTKDGAIKNIYNLDKGEEIL